jgi:hypothetical protein
MRKLNLRPVKMTVLENRGIPPIPRPVKMTGLASDTVPALPPVTGPALPLAAGLIRRQIF